MKRFMKRIEEILETGGIKKDIALLAVSGVALLVSIFDLVPLPFDAAWISVILCGIPIILEAVIGLVTAFDIKADVLVSIALIASLCIGEDFAAGAGGAGTCRASTRRESKRTSVPIAGAPPGRGARGTNNRTRQEENPDEPET